MYQRRAAPQLAAIGKVTELLTAHGIDHWLIGGWGVDFHAGRVTREHEDIEFFVWREDRAHLEQILGGSGYEHIDHPYPEEDTIWTMDDQKIEFYLIRRHAPDHVAVGGRWSDWLLPAAYLGDEHGHLGPVTCRVVAAKLLLDMKLGHWQYAETPPRARDRQDILTLRDILNIRTETTPSGQSQADITWQRGRNDATGAR